MRRRWITAMVLALAVATLAGCSAGASSDEAVLTEPGAPDGSGAAPESTTEDAAGAVPGVAPVEARSVISEGYLTITAEDPIAAADDAADIVESAGGRIDSRSERPAGENDVASADLVVRIPAERLTKTLDELKELGEVEQVSITATDVTAQTQDIDARVSALRTSTGRLTALLAGATTTADLIDIESELSERQAELESLESQQRTLADQVDLSTISVSFGSEAVAPIDRPNDFFSGVALGWEALAGFLAVTLIAVGVALPWLLLVAVLAAIVLLLIGTARRRSRRAGSSTPDGTASIGREDSRSPVAGEGTGSSVAGDGTRMDG